ncbi:hypothetical protein [Sulfitobacter sp. PS-8MA]
MLLLSLAALAACTPPAPKTPEAAPVEPGLSVSGYGSFGVVKTF